MRKNSIDVVLSLVLGLAVVVFAGMGPGDIAARVSRRTMQMQPMHQGMQRTKATSSKAKSVKTTVSKTTGSCSPRKFSAPSYTGPFFDAHLHMPSLFDFHSMLMGDGHENVSMGDGVDPILDKDVTLDHILCLFAKEQTRGAIGFSMGVVQVKDQMLAMARSIRERAKGAIHLFVMIPGYPAADIDTMLSAEKGLFTGIGEVALYFIDLKGVRPDSQRFLDVYTVAQKHNAIVMIHPDAMQEQAVESVVRAHPNVRFLFHGPELENSVHGLIAKYPNVFFSIDTSLIRLPGKPGGLMYMSRTKDEFKTQYARNYDAMMSNALRTWQPRIEEYPDRYMWGTDRAYDWMFDEDVSELIDKFSRDFIGKLKPSVQEAYAYKNAERLLQK